MEERGVGKNSVEILRRQIQLQKILVPYCAAAVLLRQLDEARRSVESDRVLSEIVKDLQIPAGPAAEVEYAKRSGAVQSLQERIAVLADIVIARAFPETLGVLIIMRKSDGCCLREFFVAELVLPISHCNWLGRKND